MLDKETVEHIAALSRIAIAEEEKALYQEELSSVLDFFTELEGADTDGAEAIGHVPGRLAVPRTDAVDEFSAQERSALLENVPEKKGRSVSVPSVLT